MNERGMMQRRGWRVRGEHLDSKCCLKFAFDITALHTGQAFCAPPLVFLASPVFGALWTTSAFFFFACVICRHKCSALASCSRRPSFDRKDEVVATLLSSATGNARHLRILVFLPMEKV